MTRWLEITPDYRCNSRCLGCYSVQDTGPSMTPREVLHALDRARRDGVHSLWIGGGEPTMRRDLFAIVKAARERGYERVKLQTNGMMLAYADFARRCAEAGVTEASFALKGATAASHDEKSRTPGSFDLLVKGMAEARAVGIALEADLLVYASTVGEVPDAVRMLAGHGVVRVRLWVLSAAESSDERVRRDVPRLMDVARAAMAARAGVAREKVVIESLHTPPCVFPEGERDLAYDVADLGLTVVNPGGHSFALEDSPIEGGVYVAVCEGCSARGRCRGLRADYVALFGDGEVGRV
jgi:MoaA/NifB/PqqE/SkfB family radical SAM enzyme